MRIIAGKLKGRVLIVPKNEIRPTLDRTKETLFNILQFSLEDSWVLDLFAGCGALGLEAYSRGAAKVCFVDINTDSIAAIKHNCTKLNCPADIIQADYANALCRLKDKFDIVFVDPPYKSNYYIKALALLSQNNLLNANCIVICEHLRDEALPDMVECLSKFRLKEIGKTSFSFYTFKED